MSLSERLIVAAKNGNTKEVRKLLSKGALFTKDQVISVLVQVVDIVHCGCIVWCINSLAKAMILLGTW